MDVELVAVGEDDDAEEWDDRIATEVQIATLMRDFANWIYKNLEAEYDYLTSDEFIDERLADDLFDEDGCMI